jgi:exodeoxyribonuclease V alpha subunit
VRAGISFAFAMDQGRCGLPTEELQALAAELLEIPAEVVDTALALELAEGAVVADTVEGRACVFLASLHRAEQGTAERLLQLLDGSLPWPAVDPTQAIPWAECKVGITLAESQREAVRLALRSKVLVITGGPGVGKTTLVNTILQIPPGQDPGHRAGRPDRPGGQAAEPGHGPGGPDPAPAARGRPGPGRLQAPRGPLARGRSAGGGRGVHGGRAAPARAVLKTVPRRALLLLMADVDQLPLVGPGFNRRRTWTPIQSPGYRRLTGF